jgi:ParB family chromosome partitioning protein
MENTRAISDIKIGDRFRRDMGDMAALAASINEIGLLHPVVINKNDDLIAGERRIRAFQLNGKTEIPVTVVDIAEIVRGEYAENEQRKDFTFSEAVAIKREIEPAIAAAAKERMVSAHASRGSVPELDKGDTREGREGYREKGALACEGREGGRSRRG